MTNNLQKMADMTLNLDDWDFKMKWCQKNRVPPSKSYWWNKAEEELTKYKKRGIKMKDISSEIAFQKSQE